MIKSFAALVLSFNVLVVMAQQDAQFSQNMFNRLTINPGYTGTNKAICATLLGRQQWVGFPGAPKTFLLSADAPILTNTMLHGGAGLTILSDQLGADKTFAAKASYSYHFYGLGVGILGIGLEAGMLQKTLGKDWIPPQTLAGDNVIPQNGTSNITYDIGLGLYYVTEDKLYVGISSTHLPQSSLQDPNYKDYKFDLTRHYYVMAGYKQQLGTSFAIKPSLLAKSDASSTQLDLNLLAEYNNQFWGGASYRTGKDAIVVLLGFQHNLGASSGTIKVGYSYDITTSTLKSYSNNTHEIMLGYCFKMPDKIKKESHQNVRFL